MSMKAEEISYIFLLGKERPGNQNISNFLEKIVELGSENYEQRIALFLYDNSFIAQTFSNGYILTNIEKQALDSYLKYPGFLDSISGIKCSQHLRDSNPRFYVSFEYRNLSIWIPDAFNKNQLKSLKETADMSVHAIIDPYHQDTHDSLQYKMEVAKALAGMLVPENKRDNYRMLIVHEPKKRKKLIEFTIDDFLNYLKSEISL